MKHTDITAASKMDNLGDQEDSVDTGEEVGNLPPELITLVGRVKNYTKETDDTLFDLLNTLRIEAKGNDKIKSFIGEMLGILLVESSVSASTQVSLAAAKLLRSITVYRKNKLLLQTEIKKILKLMSTANNELQIPLAAVLWNLSSLRQNRDILMKEGILKLIPVLLKSEGEVLNEIAGATRNLTLDERYLNDFANTDIIEGLLEVVPKANPPLLTCVLVALRNLSSSEKNQENIATPSGINALLQVLKKASIPIKDQKYVLETLAEISLNSKLKATLANSKIEQLLIPIVMSSNEILANPSKEILKNIKPDLEEKRSEVSKALNNNKLLHEDNDYLVGLLEKLNVDDQMKAKDIVLKKVIGEGAFGSVHLAEFHGYPVACKIIKTGLNKSNATKLLDELKLMRRLKHPNVVLLMGAFVNEESQIMIVTEFATRGDLKHCLPTIESLALRIKILNDIIVGLHWLQAYKIVHRDLKLDNLLVTEDFTIKITDFGLSIENDGQGYSRFGGNIKYSAPEILRERFYNKNHNYAYGERTDVYSFGLIWWQVLTKKNPFMDRPAKYPGKEGLVKYILEGYRPTLPKHWPESLRTMITTCWADQQSKRPTFRQILDKWDKLTLDLMCPDQLGRVICNTLWKDQKAKRSYEDVKKAFIETCMTVPKFKENQGKLLAHILCESNFDDSVTFSRFCYALGWFGPLDKATNCKGFFARLKDLEQQNFFHGFISDLKAENILTAVAESNSTPHPHYLLKYSLNTIGEFKLVYIDNNRKVNNLKIRNIKGKYKIGQSPKSYDNWRKVKSVCKQVLTIGTHVPRQATLNM